MYVDFDIIDEIRRLLERLNPLIGIAPLIDIAILTGLLYWISKVLSGTRAVQLVWGVVVLVAVMMLSAVVSLEALRWIIINVLQPAVVVAIPVVFQPELRRLLESLGQTYQRFNFKRSPDESGRLQMITTVARSVNMLSQQGVGALIVFERNVGLQEYVDRGVLVDARPSLPLVMAIFHPNAPLHDMAVVIRGERILAANVVLPLSEEMGGARRFGTRHRAARGISEQSDAVVLVVSEETGTITIFHDGQMISQLTEKLVETYLIELLHVDMPTTEVVA
ncbi:MAG: diadenylate cyclase CdaA [Roseiflexaceae bacterium]